MLKQHEVDAIGADLADQLARRAPFVPFPDRIPTMNDAYDVQDAHVAALTNRFSTSVGGYKIALTSKQTRQMLAAPEPCAGQVLAARIHRSPHVARFSDFIRLSIETEICVVLDNDMSGDVTFEQVRDNVRSLHCAYELVEDRGADISKLDVKSLVCDNAWNGGIVIGPAAKDPKIDLYDRTGHLKINGVAAHTGTTRETMGENPLHVVAWLAKHLAARGRKIKAGQPIITGSIIATQYPKPGDALEFEVDGIPPAMLALRS